MINSVELNVKVKFKKMTVVVYLKLRSVYTTRVHGPSSRPENSARELGCIFDTHQRAELTAVNSGAFLTPVNSGRVDGCQKMHPSSRAESRPVPSSRPVNSGRELG